MTAIFRSIDLNSPHAQALACVVVPLFFGGISVLLGQDSNWDIFNYHLYNGFSFLNGKLKTDLAPAGVATYFVPLLDVMYYLMYQHLPSRLVGFIMGFVHGLSFVLLLGISRKVLPDLPDADRHRIPLLIALSGCLTANFLSTLGNSMGDNIVALFALASLYIILAGWDRLFAWSLCTIFTLLFAGAIAGVGAALKLTNTIYAAALCLGLLAILPGWLARIRAALVFGMGALLGLVLTGGFWFYKVWEVFGNPFFPVFGSLFPNPLVESAGLPDTRWLPRDLWETVIWPFLFTLDPRRVGERPVVQIIWPVVYVVFWSWLVVRLVKHDTVTRLDPRARYTLVFVILGFLIWMNVFSIYRYIVPIEMLTPLVLWILFSRLFNYETARRICLGTVSLCAIFVVAGATTFGHVSWADPAFRAETPSIASPTTATVLLTGNNAWLATFFPKSVAFVGLGRLAESPAYAERVRSIVRQRSGETYSIVDFATNWRIQIVANANSIVDKIGLTRTAKGCAVLSWAIDRFRLHASVQGPKIERPGAVCMLGLAAIDEIDMEQKNRTVMIEAERMLNGYGFAIISDSCSLYPGFAGQTEKPYRICRVREKGA